MQIIYKIIQLSTMKNYCINFVSVLCHLNVNQQHTTMINVNKLYYLVNNITLIFISRIIDYILHKYS